MALHSLFGFSSVLLGRVLGGVSVTLLLSWPTCASKFLMEDLVLFMKLKVALDRSETIFSKLDGFCSEFSVCC
ncbi:uncharacterized protein DS421_17g586220 [Arachis hypogaea]|nr:uncharacterized protein DS421_17g586220 [Arachis hypogaea]